MRTTPFRAVVDEVLASVGLVYDSTATAQNDVVASVINRRVAEAWDWARWPEWTLSEERAFADFWRDDLAYSTGDVVWSVAQEKYYEALQTVPIGTAVTNATYWEASSAPTAREISLEQYGETYIGRVWAVGSVDPQTHSELTTYGWNEGPDKISVPDCTLDTAWVLFGRRAPKFSLKAHSGATVYASGNVVFSPSTETSGIFPQAGECYEALQDEAGDWFWSWVEFPEQIAGYVVAAASADLMRYYGNKEQAQERAAEAMRILELEVSKLGTLNGGGTVEIRMGI